MINFQQVSKTYAGGHRALEKVSFHIKPGELAFLTGHSGAGKSTLLKLISLMERPSAGNVFINGVDLNKLNSRQIPYARRDIGIIFQNHRLLERYTVFDNVAFPMREHTNLPENMIKDLVLLKLNAVGLRGAQKKLPSELSGGMARRVALARAIALDPDIIMYDEPFAGLDPISMAVICDLIRSLNDALGATSIIVTHDVAETFSFADYNY